MSYYRDDIDAFIKTKGNITVQGHLGRSFIPEWVSFATSTRGAGMQTVSTSVHLTPEQARAAAAMLIEAADWIDANRAEHVVAAARAEVA